MAIQNYHIKLTTLTLLAYAPLSTTLSTKSPLAIVENRKVPGLQNGMDYVKLGSSDLIVSKVCMGTMTFGEVSVVILMTFRLCLSLHSAHKSLLMNNILICVAKHY